MLFYIIYILSIEYCITISMFYLSICYCVWLYTIVLLLFKIVHHMYTTIDVYITIFLLLCPSFYICIYILHGDMYLYRWHSHIIQDHAVYSCVYHIWTVFYIIFLLSANCLYIVYIYIYYYAIIFTIKYIYIYIYIYI